MYRSSNDEQQHVRAGGEDEILDPQERLGSRRGLRRSMQALDIGRPSSAPPVEVQRLSRAVSSAGDETVPWQQESLGPNDPRNDPGYANYFHANSRLDPRLPPPVYAPGQSWRQIWAAPSNDGRFHTMMRPPYHPQACIPEGLEPSDDEYEDIQNQIASSSAGSSSSSSGSSPSAKAMAAQRKRLVDMIQEDFPRTPSPVYGRSRAAGGAAAGQSNDFLGFSMENLRVSEEAPVQLPHRMRPDTNVPMRFGKHPAPPPPPPVTVTSVPHSHGGKGRPRSEQIAEEIRSGIAGRSMKRVELGELSGQLVRLSVDQHGSRFIQQRLESASLPDRDRVFSELLPHALDLMTDVFGNYVIQKFFEHGSPVQQETLCGLVKGHVLELSLQMYGCRVVQKALEHGTGLCRRLICSELEGSVLRCVKDQNGNHVIQKCIECVPMDSAPFLSAAFSGQVYALATHPYGCRVIQRFFEHAPPIRARPLIEELLRYADALVRDQYGNYVIQHLLEHGSPSDKATIIGGLRGALLDLSRHKFASNVVEKAVQYGSPSDRQSFIDEVLTTIPEQQQPLETGQPADSFPLLHMMRDQYANYVVQKMLDLLDTPQRDLLLDRIRPHLPALRKYTYGKHIIAKVDRLLHDQQRSL